jgi:hypothetical protein
VADGIGARRWIVAVAIPAAETIGQLAGLDSVAIVRTREAVFSFRHLTDVVSANRTAAA